MNNKHFSIFHVFIIFILTVANVFSFPLGVSLAVDVSMVIVLGGSFILKGADKERAIITQIIILCLYTVAICVVNFEFSSYTLGKPIRMLAFYLVFFYLSGRLAKFKNEEIVFGVLLALLLHLLCVYCQFFIPSTKAIFYTFLRADDKIAIIEDPLRAFGLDASFDGAGLDICVLLLLLWVLFKRTRRIKYFLVGGVALLGCFMVGRTAMLVGTAIFTMMILSLVKKNRLYFLFALAVVAIGVYYLWDVFQFYMDNFDVNQSYRKESVTLLTTNDMLYLPDSFFGALFGTGKLPLLSDIGYVKIVHMIGIFGLLMVLYLYWTTIKFIRPFKKIDKDVYTFMLFFLLLLLAYNYKLLLLYSRGINDLYFLLIFIILRKQSTIYANNQASCIQ